MYRRPTVASLSSNEEEPPDAAGLEPTARFGTPDADLTNNHPSVIDDSGDIERNFPARPEDFGQNLRGNEGPVASTSNFTTMRSPSPLIPLGHTPPRVFGRRSPTASKVPDFEKDFQNKAAYYGYSSSVPYGYSSSVPYVAVDPFMPSVARSIANFTHSSKPMTMQPQVRPSTHTTTAENPPTKEHEVTNAPASIYILAFLLDTLPRQIYLYLQLTLPSLYFSRVSRIFEEANLYMPDIKNVAIDSAFLSVPLYPSYPSNWDSVTHLKASWEYFIDSLMKEWKTLNLVSVLLLSAILTTLQIDGAVTDPYTRYFAFLALVCSLMSLLYGCMYIIRFNTMRRTHKAAEWAEEAQKTKTSIWWNVWVLLAIPAIWLAWSIIFYLTCVMTYLWRTGTSDDTVLEITPRTALGPRLAVTFTFLLGLVYLYLIIREFRGYGTAMDQAWKKRVDRWAKATKQLEPSSYPWGTEPFAPVRPTVDYYGPPFGYGPPFDNGPPVIPSQSLGPTVLEFPPPPPLPEVLFGKVKVMDFKRTEAHIPYDRPQILEDYNIDITHEDWALFISDVSRTWDDSLFQQDPEHSSGTSVARPTQQDVTASMIASWNVGFFLRRGTQAVLCKEWTKEEPMSPSHAIYIINLQSLDRPTVAVQGTDLAQRFGQMPAGLQSMCIYDPVPPFGVVQQSTSRPLHVHWGTSRLPDPTSERFSTSDVRGLGAVDDERSIDRDGYIKPISNSLDPPSAMQSINPSLTTPAPVSDDEEHNRPLTLPDQEISRSDGQLNRQNIDYSDSNDVSRRPKDLRPNYKVQKTPVDEFRDPIERLIYKGLSYAASSPRVNYDLRFLPDLDNLDRVGRAYKYYSDFVRLATNPPVHQMRLFHPLLPWYIDVRQENDNGVTVENVFLQMYLELQMPVDARYYFDAYFDEGLSKGTRKRISRAFEVRTEDRPEERSKGIKKVDYLEDQVIFVGLVRVKHGLWEIKTRAVIKEASDEP